MQNSKIYIGGGFMQSQIYWVLPIAVGYAKTKGIKEIILKIKLKFLSLVKFIIYLRLSFGFFLLKIYFYFRMYI